MTRPIVYHNRPGQVGKRSFLYAKNCLSEANETIKGYKDMDIDAIKKSAGDREDKYKASVKELEDMRLDNPLYSRWLVKRKPSYSLALPN